MIGGCTTTDIPNLPKRRPQCSAYSNTLFLFSCPIFLLSSGNSLAAGHAGGALVQSWWLHGPKLPPARSRLRSGIVKKRAGLFASLLCTEKMDMWTGLRGLIITGERLGFCCLLSSVEGLIFWTFIFCLHFLSFFGSIFSVGSGLAFFFTCLSLLWMKDLLSLLCLSLSLNGPSIIDPFNIHHSPLSAPAPARL